MRIPKLSPLYAFIRSWKRLRGISTSYLVRTWGRGTRALIYSPDAQPRYALIVREGGAFMCHEHEVSLLQRPRLLAVFFAAVQEHKRLTENAAPN